MGEDLSRELDDVRDEINQVRQGLLFNTARNKFQYGPEKGSVHYSEYPEVLFDESKSGSR
jgi:hypothetical protein